MTQNLRKSMGKLLNAIDQPVHCQICLAPIVDEVIIQDNYKGSYILCSEPCRKRWQELSCLKQFQAVA